MNIPLNKSNFVPIGVSKTEYTVKRCQHGFVLVQATECIGVVKPREDKRGWFAKLLFPACFQTKDFHFSYSKVIAAFNTEEELRVYADLQGIEIGKPKFEKLTEPVIKSLEF